MGSGARTDLARVRGRKALPALVVWQVQHKPLPWLLAGGSAIPTLQLPTSSWCWCYGQYSFLSPGAGGKPKHVFLLCCSFVMTIKNRWYTIVLPLTVYTSNPPPVLPLVTCQNKIQKYKNYTCNSSKKQILLLCQNNLYLYTNKEIIINLEDFALIFWSILVIGCSALALC